MYLVNLKKTAWTESDCRYMLLGFYALGDHAIYLGPETITIGKREATKVIARVITGYVSRRLHSSIHFELHHVVSWFTDKAGSREAIIFLKSNLQGLKLAVSKQWKKVGEWAEELEPYARLSNGLLIGRCHKSKYSKTKILPTYNACYDMSQFRNCNDFSNTCRPVVHIQSCRCYFSGGMTLCDSDLSSSSQTYISICCFSISDVRPLLPRHWTTSI